MNTPLTDNGATTRRASQTEIPHYHVKENERSAIIDVYLPGVSKADINLRFDAGRLDLRAARPRRNKENWQLTHREISEHDFALKIGLGKTYDGRAATAQSNNGVLRITVPRAATARPKEISVTGE